MKKKGKNLERMLRDFHLKINKYQIQEILVKLEGVEYKYHKKNSYF